MFPHALYLFAFLYRVGAIVIRPVHFLHLQVQNSSNLIRIEVSISIKVVHGEESVGIEVLGIHVILLLPHFLQLWLAARLVNSRVFLVVFDGLVVLLLHFDPLLGRHVLQTLSVLKLLAHLVLLEFSLALFVQRLQVLRSSDNQLLQVFNFKGVWVLVINVVGHLDAVTVQAKFSLLGLHGEFSQPVQFNPLEFIQAVSDIVFYKLKFVSHTARPYVIDVYRLQLRRKVWVILKCLNYFLKVATVLQAEIGRLFNGVLLGWLFWLFPLVYWRTDNSLQNKEQ